MKRTELFVITAGLCIGLLSFNWENEISQKSEVNEVNNDSLTPLVNYDYFEELVKEVKSHRKQRLISLATFNKKAKEPNTVILDSRSKAMYDQKHIKGAVHLNFSDFTQETLNNLFATYAGMNTQILIYCNNNFYDSKAFFSQLQDMAFPSKAVVTIEEPLSFSNNNNKIKSLALNIPTYINLYGYGYKNVFELNEFIDVNSPLIEFEGTEVAN